MKRVSIHFILIFWANLLFAQNVPIKEHCWKLEELNIDNVIYTVPTNDEIDYVFLNISDSTTENGGYFGTTICNYFFGDILIDENEFSFTNHSNSNLACELEDTNSFDDLYIYEFYVNHINSPFEYSFYQENDWLYLIITNSVSDTVKYGVYLNTVLTNNIWTLENVTVNNETYYPPVELEDNVTLSFSDDNSKTISTNVCDTFSGNVYISNSEIVNFESGVSDLICEEPINTFDYIYINSFFINLLDYPFQYDIQTSENEFILTLSDIFGNQAIYYSQNLSVTESVDTKLYSVYPNPVNEILTIKGLEQNKVSIQIFDVSGKLVYHNKLNVNQNKIEIPVSHLEKGIYFMKIFNQFGKFIHSEKILKN